MELFTSKDAPEPGQLTAGSTSPTVGDLTVADLQEAREVLRENDIFKNAKTEGLLFEFVANAPCTFGGNHTNAECACDPYDHGDIVEPSNAPDSKGQWFYRTPYYDPSPDFHKTRVIPTPEDYKAGKVTVRGQNITMAPYKRQVDTAIRKTVCAIRHIPSGEYVTKGFRGTTKDPLKIRFWDRKADARKVLSNWFQSNNMIAAALADFEFIEREVFLPSTETF